MKPTVDYVRGLRDVLEIPTKEERRDNYIRGEKRGCLYSFCNLGFVPIVLYVSETRNIPDDLRLLIMGSILLGSMYNTIYVSRIDIKRKKIARAGRAHQENIRNGTPVPRGLEREAFD
ncbi:MAG: hypothetical protein AABX12_04060, partial [Nanoarchaeota archaeon]